MTSSLPSREHREHKIEKEAKKTKKKEKTKEGKVEKVTKKRARQESDGSIPVVTTSDSRRQKPRQRQSSVALQRSGTDDDQPTLPSITALDTDANCRATPPSTVLAACDDESDERHRTQRPLVESSALPQGVQPDLKQHSVSLLLFYQYVEPPWTDGVYKRVKERVYQIGTTAGVSGRMRIAKEGLNCTLTGNPESVRQFCHGLREWKPEHFDATEFKVTHHLEDKYKFNGLKVMPVTELVHYGLEGDKAPPIQNYSGVHLEPAQYHEKLAESNTVIIDVRNHYEAAIGRFVPPSVMVDTPNAKDATAGPLFLDPKMRKSTEFPVWLDSDETKEKLKGKQVLMYCTGGIRCERASALLKFKMETDPSVKELGIQGVYQLQGGIDKYFKEFPDGGYWKGKNYTFDKRFAHAPVEHEVENDVTHKSSSSSSKSKTAKPLGKCESCSKPWDKYRGKRRCPTCGVPSLICKDCYQADQEGVKKLGKWVRCDLCVEQGVSSKKDLRDKEQKELKEYENRLQGKGLPKPTLATDTGASVCSNPDGTTRLYLKNMCRKNMTEDVLLSLFPEITHIVWRTDRKTGQFFGQGWVEMNEPAAATNMVSRSGEMVLGRPLHIEFQPPDGKDVWPPPKSAV